MQEPSGSHTVQEDEKTTSSRENPLLSLVFNIALPTLVLTKLSGEDRLGPEYGFLLAMSLPLIYGVYDYVARREISWIAVLGFVSILIKGSLGMMKLDGFWFAVNEAALPGLLALGTLVARVYKPMLIRRLIFNDKLIRTELVMEKLVEERAREEFEKSLRRGSLLIGLSFVVSSVLNFVLAVYFLKSPAGTEAFNAELGYMTAVSYPVIMASSSSLLIFAVVSMARTVRRLTGLSWEEIFKVEESPKAKS